MFPNTASSAPQMPNNLTEAQEAALADPSNQALVIERGFATAVLASIAKKTLGSVVQPAGYLAFQDRFMAESGTSKDPIETLLRQELLWAHFRVGDLHAQAAAATSPELMALYTAAAARLMAEIRKSILALHELATPAKLPQGAVANQQGTMDNGAATQSSVEKKSFDSKLGTNEAPHDNADQPNAHPSSDRQPVEQVKAKRAVGGRQAAAA